MSKRIYAITCDYTNSAEINTAFRKLINQIGAKYNRKIRSVMQKVDARFKTEIIDIIRRLDMPIDNYISIIYSAGLDDEFNRIYVMNALMHSNRGLLLRTPEKNDNIIVWLLRKLHYPLRELERAGYAISFLLRTMGLTCCEQSKLLTVLSVYYEYIPDVLINALNYYYNLVDSIVTLAGKLHIPILMTLLLNHKRCRDRLIYAYIIEHPEEVVPHAVNILFRNDCEHSILPYICAHYPEMVPSNFTLLGRYRFVKTCKHVRNGAGGVLSLCEVEEDVYRIVSIKCLDCFYAYPDDISPKYAQSSILKGCCECGCKHSLAYAFQSGLDCICIDCALC